MSSDLQWLILRKQNSFLVKRNGVQFTREPNNLMNMNTYKYSGLANRRTLALTPAADGKAIDFTIKSNTQAGRKMQAHKSVVKLAKYRGNRNLANVIRKETIGKSFRSDLTRVALARLTRLNTPLKVKKAGVAKKTKRQRRGHAQKPVKTA